MNTQETNLQRHGREMREAADRLHAKHDPQQKAMAAAMQPTKAELAELTAAQAVVVEAEAAVSAAERALLRAMEAKPKAPTGFDFFTKSKDAYRAAAAAVSLPSLKIDLHEARTALSSAIRRRNMTASTIDRARMERRWTAKSKHFPKREKPASRNEHGRRIVIDRSDAA